MRARDFLLFSAFLVLTGAMILNAADKATTSPFHYPEARKSDQVDDYHGTKVADPYRWLENLDSPEVKSWVDAENKVTFAYLETIPQRAAIKARLTEALELRTLQRSRTSAARATSTPRTTACRTRPCCTGWSRSRGEPHMLLDPNTLSPDGTVALSGIAVSETASSWPTAFPPQAPTGRSGTSATSTPARILPDDLKWVKFSGASWTKDGKGFFYSRYDEPSQASMMQAANYFQKLYFHSVGTPQSEDVLIYERPDQKELAASAATSPTTDATCHRQRLARHRPQESRLLQGPAASPMSQVVRLLDDFDAGYHFIDNDGPVFWFLTDLDAPRGRVIAIDTRHPERKNWKVDHSRSEGRARVASASSATASLPAI